MNPPAVTTALFSLVFASTLCAAESPASSQWPQWRGPLASGIAPDARPPLEWSESKNIRWKVKIPGRGSSTPIVWRHRIYLTSAVPAGAPAQSATPVPQAESRPPGGDSGGRRGGGGMRRSEAPTVPYESIVLCLDRATGAVVWQQVVNRQTPHEGHHQDHGYASPSIVTDGTHLYASFGSRGLYCLDMNGKVIWSKDLGKMQTRNSFGEGSSPALAGKAVIVNWDHEGEDFIVALDKATGGEIWRKQRDEPTGWSTPLVVEHAGKLQVVVNATNRIRSYDAASGEVLWECGGMTTNAIPMPVHAGGLVYVASGFRGSALKAIKLGRTGDLTGTDAVVWSHDTKTPYVPSPLWYEGRLYFFSQNTGMLSVLEAATGRVLVDAERIPGLSGVYASPVAAAGRVYLTGRNGTVVVVKPSDALEILATNVLDEKFDASPSIVGREIYLRGQEYLYCVADPQATGTN